MNNSDFRSLLTNDKTSAVHSGSTKSNSVISAARTDRHLTPRALKNGHSNPFLQAPNFANGTKHTSVKKFKSSVVKGTKLATGYNDRAQQRKAIEATEKAKESRMRALEEQLNSGQITKAAFEDLRSEIANDSVGGTPVVKGLDWKLLERARRGEDVQNLGSSESSKSGIDGQHDVEGVNEDEAFDDIERAEVAPVKREVVEKKGEMAPAIAAKPVAGIKRSRNDVLAEFRAQRQAEEEARRTAHKKGWKQDLLPGATRIERDAKGREVLITVDENGNVKRKVRKVAPPTPPETAHNERVIKPEAVGESGSRGTSNARPVESYEEHDNVVPEKARRKKTKNAILGEDANYTSINDAQQSITVDDKSRLEPEVSDDDIFEGVGDDYDPLAGLQEEDENASSTDDCEEAGGKRSAKAPEKDPTDGEAAQDIPDDNGDSSGELSDDATEPPKANSNTAEPSKCLPLSDGAPKRNYFGTCTTADGTFNHNRKASFKDPELLAALKRASDIAKREEADREAQASKSGKGSTAAERLLGNRDRDFEDMDMGFGESRADDEEDGDDAGRTRLSEWKGIGTKDDGAGELQGRSGQGQRKRGKKKKKGDKNSASDVLKIMEGRKK